MININKKFGNKIKNNFNIGLSQNKKQNIFWEVFLKVYLVFQIVLVHMCHVPRFENMTPKGSSKFYQLT